MSACASRALGSRLAFSQATLAIKWNSEPKWLKRMLAELLALGLHSAKHTLALKWHSEPKWLKRIQPIVGSRKANLGVRKVQHRWLKKPTL